MEKLLAGEKPAKGIKNIGMRPVKVDYIKRDIYIDRIRPFIGKNIIKIITGQRRVGKSYLLFQIMDEIRKMDKKGKIIYINKEQHEFDKLANHEDLIGFIEARSAAGHTNYIFIDEVQEIEGFEKALRSLGTRPGFDIYCTGSNSNLLSSEIATRLAGRYINFEVYPLSYREFLRFHKLEDGMDSFLSYLKYGGLPYLIHLELKDEITYEYLKNIYNTILFKDVVGRFGVRNTTFLERLIEFLANNTGSLVSAKK